MLISMLNHIVVNMEAKALGITVTDDEVKQELARTIVGYESEAQYYAQMQSQLGLSRQEVFAETDYRLSLQAIATVGITISDADIDAYLEQNAERFIPKKEMQLSMIKVSSYEEGQQVMDRLEQGENFADLAREVSNDDESRQHGGSLGKVEEDDPFWPEGMLKTAAGLDVGDIAGPIETGRLRHYPLGEYSLSRNAGSERNSGACTSRAGFGASPSLAAGGKRFTQ